LISPRRFPRPWTLEENNNACFIVRDKAGQARLFLFRGRSRPAIGGEPADARRSMEDGRELRQAAEPVASTVARRNHSVIVTGLK
jgi:hypothetical protein